MYSESWLAISCQAENIGRTFGPYKMQAWSDKVNQIHNILTLSIAVMTSHTWTVRLSV